jgi:hypothetical protein
VLQCDIGPFKVERNLYQLHESCIVLVTLGTADPLVLFEKKCLICLYFCFDLFSVALIIFLVCFLMRRHQPEYLLSEPDKDIRENIVAYDEEGAGLCSLRVVIF